MGGGESIEHHHYHTVYQVPAEVTQQLKEQSDELANIKEEAIKQHDPNLFKENSVKMFNKLLENLPKLNLTDGIIKKTGETHVAFIGPISSGKTSTINTLFNKNLPVALGHCTDKCEAVHEHNELIIWDAPGNNDDFIFYDPVSLSFVKSLDKFIILFDNDIAMISNILRVVYAINNNIIVIRTKLDQYSSTNVRTVEQEKALDIQKIKNLLGEDCGAKLFYTSCHNVTNKASLIYDWIAFTTELGI